MKTPIYPAANYLLVYPVEVKEFNVLNGLLIERAEKDIIGQIGYIEETGKNTDKPVNARLVIFNTKLGTKLADDDTSCYLIHKSAVLAYMSEGTIVYRKYNDNGYNEIEVELSEQNECCTFDYLIDKYGKIIESY